MRCNFTFCTATLGMTLLTSCRHQENGLWGGFAHFPWLFCTFRPNGWKPLVIVGATMTWQKLTCGHIAKVEDNLICFTLLSCYHHLISSEWRHESVPLHCTTAAQAQHLSWRNEWRKCVRACLVSECELFCHSMHSKKIVAYITHDVAMKILPPAPKNTMILQMGIRCCKVRNLFSQGEGKYFRNLPRVS